MLVQASDDDQRLCQQGLLGLDGGEALAQVGAQGAQGGYAGDDAGLFSEGWEGERHSEYFGRFQFAGAMRWGFGSGRG